MRADGKKNYALLDEDGNETSTFTGRQPRHAALKAARRGVKDIRLRELGTKKVHCFTGEKVPKLPPETAPEWLRRRGVVFEGKVTKLGVERLE